MSELEQPPPIDSEQPPLVDSSAEPLQSLPTMTLEQWLETLHRADRAFYNIMAMEVWSIAKTMDNLFPGFWNRFMNNRQAAMKEFVAQKKRPPFTEEPEQSSSE